MFAKRRKHCMLEAVTVELMLGSMNLAVERLWMIR